MYSSCRQEVQRESRTSREVFIDKKAKSLYVTQSSRQNNIKHRMISFLTRQATKDFQTKLIQKSLATKNRYVKLFIDKMLARKFFQTQFKEYHFKILNEKHQEYTQLIEAHQLKIANKLQRMCYPIYNWIAFQIVKIPLIYPQSIYKTFWDLIATAARLYFLYMIPVDLAWTQQQLLFSNYQYSTTIMLIILLADILISLNTAFYEAGQIVISRVAIIKNVIFQSFGLEWISVLLVLSFLIFTKLTDTIVDINSHPYFLVLLLFLSHFKNVQNKGKQYEMALNFTKFASSCLQLFKFTLLIFYVIHLFGCLWFWVGQYSEIYVSQSWIESRNLIEKPWNIQYLSSFYYACVTMFTVGYGDITPQSDEERIVAIILIMVSSVQLPYSINTVGNIIQDITSQSEILKNNIRIINTYLHKKRIPYAFQEQIREYLKQYWHMKEEQETQEENTIISQLSEKLQEQLMWQVHTQVIREMPFFSSFSRQFQKALSKRISVVDLLPDNEFRKETDQFVCYLEKGEISVSLDGYHKIKLQKIVPGNAFGLKNFILGTQPQETYKSVGFSKLLLIGRYDFLQLLKEYPRDFEIYCKLRDSLIFAESYYDEQCLSCASITHSVLNCPMLHFVPQKELIIKRYQYNQNQNRRRFYRREKSKKYKQQQIKLEDLEKIQEIHNKRYFIEFQEKPNNEEKSIINVPKIIVQNSAPAQSPHIPSRNSSSKHIPDPLGIGLQFQGLKYSVSIVAKPQIKSDFSYERQNNLQNINYDPQVNNQLNNMVEEQLKQRYEQLKNYQNLPQNDQDAISFLIMKYKNYKKFQKKEFTSFEQMKSFTDYYPEHNASRVIQKVNQRSSNEILLQFMPYLLYPYLYYERFKKQAA